MRYVAFMLVMGTLSLAVLLGSLGVQLVHDAAPTPTQVSVR